jgi:hypothetical protein
MLEAVRDLFGTVPETSLPAVPDLLLNSDTLGSIARQISDGMEACNRNTAANMLAYVRLLLPRKEARQVVAAAGICTAQRANLAWAKAVTKKNHALYACQRANGDEVCERGTGEGEKMKERESREK